MAYFDVTIGMAFCLLQGHIISFIKSPKEQKKYWFPVQFYTHRFTHSRFCHVKLMTVFRIGPCSLYICSVIRRIPFQTRITWLWFTLEHFQNVCSKIITVFFWFSFVLIHIIRFSRVTIKTTLQTVRKTNKFYWARSSKFISI